MTTEPVERVKTNLEIEEHLSMQERGWKVQKVGLYFIFAMVLAAAVGLYGDGPLSKRRLSQNNATVEFERFYRFEAQMELKVEVNAFTNADGLSVMFPAKYLDHFQVESILPEPEKTVVEGDQLVYIFSGSGDFSVTYHLTPRSIGEINGLIKINDNQFRLRHFIFP